MALKPEAIRDLESVERILTEITEALMRAHYSGRGVQDLSKLANAIATERDVLRSIIREIRPRPPTWGYPLGRGRR